MLRLIWPLIGNCLHIWQCLQEEALAGKEAEGHMYHEFVASKQEAPAAGGDSPSAALSGDSWEPTDLVGSALAPAGAAAAGPLEGDVPGDSPASSAPRAGAPDFFFFKGFLVKKSPSVAIKPERSRAAKVRPI